MPRPGLLFLIAQASALKLPAHVGGRGGSSSLSRRSVALGAAAALVTSHVSPAPAVEALGLEDLPPKAQSAYKQYWPAMQLAGDFYVFELRDLIGQPGRWDVIAALTESTDIGSAASVSKFEREFLTPMRILSLAFPPDAGGEEMQDALNKFQQVVYQMTRQARAGQTTGNLANPSGKEVAALEAVWNAGAVQINAFYNALNTATSVPGQPRTPGLPLLVPIPVNGVGYPRKKSLYTQLMKDSALCRNRGGEALAGLWGNLMVYGTVPGVNPCGSMNMQTYFLQN